MQCRADDLAEFEKLMLLCTVLQVESMDAIIEEELVRDGESESKTLNPFVPQLETSVWSLFWPN